MTERWWPAEESLPVTWTPEEKAERERIIEALSQPDNATRAAESLGMSRGTLIAKLEKYRIPRPARSSPSAIEAERLRVVEALALAEGDEVRAAEHLQLPVRALVARMEYFGIRRGTL
jgi:transcriptional regulator with GAF, ATPase, and Fis domain